MATSCLMAAAICAALAPGSLNDVDKTPGVARTTVAKVICTLKTTRDVRKVTASMKKQVFATYELTDKTGWCKKDGCEVDHLISLELGGSNDVKNLWPQPYGGEWNAHLKDKLENRLHKMICNKSISVKDAQYEISHDWINAYKKYIGD